MYSLPNNQESQPVASELWKLKNSFVQINNTSNIAREISRHRRAAEEMPIYITR